MPNRWQAPTIQRQLSIQKAMEFVGDNSVYQKQRLVVLGVGILAIAILTALVPLDYKPPPTPEEATSIWLPDIAFTTLFLAACGAGQLICPTYLPIPVIARALGLIAILGMAIYPLSGWVFKGVLLALGFLGRGLYVCGLIYVNEIGGQRYRGWATTVVFGLWGLSWLVSSLTNIFDWAEWAQYYLLILIPLVGVWVAIMKQWAESPLSLYSKRKFGEALIVLNTIANRNDRPSLPYALQGQTTDQALLYKQPTYMDLLTRPVLRKISLSLIAVWIYRQYLYYGSYMLVPQMGLEHEKNYILVSIAQSVAVLVSYPLRMQVKRVSTFLFCAGVAALSAALASFTTIPQECLLTEDACVAKYLYRLSMLMLRFTAGLMGNVLVTYTLEVYPSDTRHLALPLCLAASAAGSLLIPWILTVLLYAHLSGFILFALTSCLILNWIIKLPQTHGRMNTDTLQQMQQQSPAVALNNWMNLKF